MSRKLPQTINQLSNYKGWFLIMVLFLCCVATFLLYPNLDLSVSNYFYKNDAFFLKDNIVVRFIYLVFAKIQILYLAILIGLIIYFHKKQNFLNKKYCIFMLVCLFLAPGLVVNTLLKDNSVGRPRPVHVQEFGGIEKYTAAFRYSGACKRNCSFVSGHAAIGFYLFVLAWVFKSRYWLLPGLITGLGVGFVRIIQGGHFLSDVLFAGWVVYFSCLAVAMLMRLTSHDK